MLSPWVMSDSATPWTVAHKAPLSMGFPRPKYWSGLPFPSPGNLPGPGIKPGLLHCRQILHCHQGSPQHPQFWLKLCFSAHVLSRASPIWWPCLPSLLLAMIVSHDFPCSCDFDSWRSTGFVFYLLFLSWLDWGYRFGEGRPQRQSVLHTTSCQGNILSTWLIAADVDPDTWLRWCLPVCQLPFPHFRRLSLEEVTVSLRGLPRWLGW